MKMKDHYPNGECPDCGDPIADDTEEGYACLNCGHVFHMYSITPERAEAEIHELIRTCDGETLAALYEIVVPTSNFMQIE
jgi:hypothetical protein